MEDSTIELGKGVWADRGVSKRIHAAACMWLCRATLTFPRYHTHEHSVPCSARCSVCRACAGSVISVP